MITNPGRELSDFLADAGVPSIQNDRINSGGKTDETTPDSQGQQKHFPVFRWDDGNCDRGSYNGGDVRDQERGIHVNGSPQGLPLSFDLSPLFFGQLHLLLLGDDLVLVSVSDLDQDPRAHYDDQEADNS